MGKARPTVLSRHTTDRSGESGPDGIRRAPRPWSYPAASTINRFPFPRTRTATGAKARPYGLSSPRLHQKTGAGSAGPRIDRNLYADKIEGGPLHVRQRARASRHDARIKASTRSAGIPTNRAHAMSNKYPHGPGQDKRRTRRRSAAKGRGGLRFCALVAAGRVQDGPSAHPEPRAAWHPETGRQFVF